MGATKGTVSYSVYHVEGELPRNYFDLFIERISEFRFVELTPDSEEDHTFGWAVVDDMLSTDFDRQNTFLGEYVVLSLRLDRWSLPNQLLKAQIKRTEEEKTAERGAKLPRAERDAIREMTIRRMKELTLPASTVIDLVWNVDEQVVRFWTHSAKTRERFEELFESTFELKLRPDSPYVAALQAELTDDEIAALDGIEQEEFGQIG